MEPSEFLLFEYLLDGGEMGERISNVEWANTPLGPAKKWSTALWATLAMMLNNRFPMLLWWTKDYISFYNDAYIPILGDKHPQALGLPVKECWSEIWHVLQPLIDKPFKGHGATWMEDIQLILNRKEYAEETHFVIAYSPIPDAEAPTGIGGVLATVNEITDQVIGNRTLTTLSKISLGVTEAQTEEAVYEKLAGALSANKKDFPFCIIYKIDENGAAASVARTTGFEKPHTGLIPSSSIDLKNHSTDPLNLVNAVSKNAIFVSEFDQGLKNLPTGEWEVEPKWFVHIPIKTPNRQIPQAILTIALNPYRRFDEAYRQFVQLAADHMATGLMNVFALAEEKKRLKAFAEIDRAKTVFFTNISHELRTPLTLLLSPVEEMIKPGHQLSVQAIRENHEMIYRNGQRLLKMVNTLLDFSSIEAGKIEAKLAATDLTEFTSDVASGFRPVIEKAGLKFEVQCAILNRPVLIDREMWEKVILNLLSNAFKFTLKGRITVKLYEKDNGVNLEVSDTGIGIPKNELPRMFQRFHRVEGMEGRTYEGSGIGLSLIYELVKLHHGTIHVVSEAGSGSTFTVWLPFGSSESITQTAVTDLPDVYGKLASAFLDEAKALLGEEPKTETSSSAPPGENYTVLVADDNSDMRDYLTRILSPRWNVVVAKNGREALDMIRKKAPDVIMSDIMMPVMDGIELLQLVRSEFNPMRIPFIFLSARAGEEEKIEGLKYGADDYLVKPFSANELLAKVQTQLEANKAKNQAEKYLKQLFTNAPVAICMLKGPSHKIELANERMLKIWGKAQHEIADKSLSQVLPPDVYQHLENIMQPDSNHQSAEIVITDEFSERMVVNYVAEPLVGQDGAMDSIILLANEITDLVAARKNAMARADEFYRLAKEKAEFMSIASHELKTPVTSMKAILQLLQRVEMPNKQISDFVERANRQVHRLSVLVNDLLDVSALEAGKINFSLEEFDFHVLLAEAVQQHQVAQNTHRVTVVQNVPAGVTGDYNRLGQVVNNFISNAIKYSPKADEVWISSVLTDKGIKVTVTDFGIGIPQDKLAKVFDRFYRVEEEATRYPGMGLGLFISAEIIRRHQGSIGAGRRPEGGSTFWFEIPLSQAGGQNSI